MRGERTTLGMEGLHKTRGPTRSIEGELGCVPRHQLAVRINTPGTTGTTVMQHEQKNKLAAILAGYSQNAFVNATTKHVFFLHEKRHCTSCWIIGHFSNHHLWFSAPVTSQRQTVAPRFVEPSLTSSTIGRALETQRKIQSQRASNID